MTLPATGTTTLTNWSTAAPYYPHASFNAATGTFTAPTTGRYGFKVTINYGAGTLTANIGGTADPAFFLRRNSPVTTNLIAGNLEVIDVNIALVLTLRIIPSNGQVVMTGDVLLNAGDTVVVLYFSDGLNVPIPLGGAANQPGAVFSCMQLG